MKNMERKKILVFPCGSEIGLEIHRSLKYSRHFEVFGGNSVDDHGKFVFENYIGEIPFVNDKNFIRSLRKIIKKYKIDAVYPTMDKVITTLAENQKNLDCKIICSPLWTTQICLSKSKTYDKFKDLVLVPKIYKDVSEIDSYPVFLKPDIGYGARGTAKVNNKDELNFQLKKNPFLIILEYLEGEEYTVDCFTNRKGQLLFVGPRKRCRIRTGISVNTKTILDINGEFRRTAEIINSNLELRGAWFFQLKRDTDGNLKLLEIASRLGGSSAVFRPKGINFSLFTLWDAFGYDVEIIENYFHVEMDRALNCVFKYDINFDTVYVDFDDCLIINNKVNTSLVKFLFDCINRNKKIVLLTKHDGNIDTSLVQYKLSNIFDEIIHISKKESKSAYISYSDSIFIDDSFIERKEVKSKCDIPVFSPDMINNILVK